MSQLFLSRRVSLSLTRAPQRQCKVSALPWASGSDRASAPQATQTVPVSAQDKGPGDELSHATEVLTKAASYDIQTPPMQWAITKSQLAVAKETLAEMKRHTLQWAITHAELGTFEFHDKGSKQRSTDLVKLVLLTFMTDAGFQIPSGYSLNSSRNPADQERQAFHSALAQHIHQLTGVKPRIVKQSSGTGAEAAEQYVIYRV